MLRKEVLQKQFEISRDIFKYIPFYKHSDVINSLACSPDNIHLLVGSDKYLYYIDMRNGEKCEILCHDSFINSVAFNQDGSLALTGSSDKFAILHDCITKKFYSRKMLGPHVLYISSVALNPKGNLALTGSWDENIILWDLNSFKFKIFSGHTCTISGLAFLNNDEFLSSSWDGTLRIWSVKSNNFEELANHSEPISALSVSKNLNFGLYSLNSDAYFIDLRTRETLLILRHSKKIKAIALNSDGSFAIITYDDGYTYIWDLKKKTYYYLFFNPDESARFVTFNVDDQYAIIGYKQLIYILKIPL